MFRMLRYASLRLERRGDLDVAITRLLPSRLALGGRRCSERGFGDWFGGNHLWPLLIRRRKTRRNVGQFISKKFMIASRWRYQAAKRQGETMTDKFRFCSLYRDELGRCPGTASRLRPAKATMPRLIGRPWTARACTSLRLSDKKAVYEAQTLQLVTDRRGLGTTR